MRVWLPSVRTYGDWVKETNHSDPERPEVDYHAELAILALHLPPARYAERPRAGLFFPGLIRAPRAHG